MAVLTPGKPLIKAGPQVLIENQLKPGRYRFQLVVTDDSGLESDPAELVVTIFEPAPEPTPTPTPPTRDPTGPVLRPDLRVERLERVERVLRPVDPRIVRPLRRPQG